MGRPPAIPYDEIPKMKFGRLKPIKRIEGSGRTKWLCKCDCGNETIVIQKNLCNGNTKSCGCLAREISPSKTHGMSKTRLYTLWLEIKKRCYSPNDNSYKWYGGKGISVCKEWLDDFMNFHDWAIKNGYDETLPRGVQTIDRIDYNGNYCPENCRWITIQEQQRNKVSNTPYELNGESHLLCEWAEILGLDYNLLRSRVVSDGWTLEQALREPLNARPNNKVIHIEYNGENLSIKEWSRKLGIKESTIRIRMTQSKDAKYILNTEKNQRKDSLMVEYKGETKNLGEWAKELGINYGTLKRRFKSGWSAEKMFETK